MLASIVGQVDSYSVAVLIAIALALCIILTTAIGKRRSKRKLEMQFKSFLSLLAILFLGLAPLHLFNFGGAYEY